MSPPLTVARTDSSFHGGEEQMSCRRGFEQTLLLLLLLGTGHGQGLFLFSNSCENLWFQGCAEKKIRKRIMFCLIW